MRRGICMEGGGSGVYCWNASESCTKKDMRLLRHGGDLEFGERLCRKALMKSQLRKKGAYEGTSSFARWSDENDDGELIID